jgi:hypothetical protein
MRFQALKTECRLAPIESAQDCIPASEFRWIFVKTTATGSYTLEAFTLANDYGHMSLEGACHSVQPLDDAGRRTILTLYV